MSDPTQEDPGLSISQTTPMWLMYSGIGVVIFLIFGLVTWVLGLGPFAYRQFYYGTSEIYILNMTDHPVEVTLDKGTPFKVGLNGVRRTPILGGTTTIVTRDTTGKVIETHEVFVDGAPIFYNIEGERCLVLSDVSSFYLSTPGKGIAILETYNKIPIIHLPHDRIIWPRQTLRDTVKGAKNGVAWIELASCGLLEPEERHILESHLNIKLTERKKHEQDLKRQLEIQRQMIQGGSEGVDEYVKDLDARKKRKRSKEIKGIKLKIPAANEPTP